MVSKFNKTVTILAKLVGFLQKSVLHANKIKFINSFPIIPVSIDAPQALSLIKLIIASLAL